MRLHDYMKILAPFNSNVNRQRERRGMVSELRKVKINNELDSTSLEDVAITHTHLTYVK